MINKSILFYTPGVAQSHKDKMIVKYTFYELDYKMTNVKAMLATTNTQIVLKCSTNLQSVTMGILYFSQRNIKDNVKLRIISEGGSDGVGRLPAEINSIVSEYVQEYRV